MKAKKILTMALCAVLLVCISVGATVAYLTSRDEVKNTFTVGKVQITLDEADVDLMGEWDGANGHNTRVKANEYKLLPNHTYKKDPTVTVLTGSEESYIRMLVTVNDLADLKTVFPTHIDANGVFLLQDFVGGWDSTEWVMTTYKDNGDNTATYEFRYFETVVTVNDANVPTGDKVLGDLFETITIPGDVINTELAELEELEIKIVAQAIQADGFGTAELAWAQWK